MSRRWAVLVPVKDPRLGKSRLARVLEDAAREALNHSLAQRTFEACAEAAGAAACFVITASAAITREATVRGLRAEPEPPVGGLNPALAAGAAAASAAGFDALLVVPTDLVDVGASALREVMAAMPASGGCVLVPDRHGAGTNVLALAPARTDLFRYGDGSLRAHEEAAGAAGLAVRRLPHPALALDLDLPEDLALWRAPAR